MFNIIPAHKAVIISADDLKELKGRIEKIREWIRERNANSIHQGHNIHDEGLISSINKELAEIEFPEE